MKLRLVFVYVLFLLLIPAFTKAATIGVPPNYISGTGLSSGLISWWTFDGKDTPWTSATAATALDKSGNGNTATLTNMAQATSPVDGKTGQGLFFDAVNDFVDVTAINFPSTNEFSYSFWMRSPGYAGTKYIISWGSQRWCRFRFTGSNYLICSVTGSDTGATAALQSFVNDSKWHHIVYTSTTGAQELYIDGVSRSTSVQTLNTTGTNFKLGFQTGGGAENYYNGSLDDVRIYNRALSATEIRQLYSVGASTKVGSSPPVTATSSCATGLSCGLVGYWTFDGKDVPNGRANDVSGNGNHGSLVNIATSTFYTSGKIGQGFKFDGVDDYVNTNHHFNEVTDGPRTISAWVTRSSGTDFVYALGVRYTTARTANAITADTNWKTSYRATGLAYLDSGVPVVFNKWTHIAMTQNENNVAMYLNGEPVASASNAEWPSTQSGTLSTKFTYIGAINANGTPSSYWPGSIDDVRIYDRVLSAAEVRQLYSMGASTKVGTSPSVTNTTGCSSGLSCGLVGYWTFDGKDVPNGRANDVSGNGNHGSLVNISTSTFYASGKTGQGFKFDGSDDYVNTNLNVNSSLPLSISAWFKASAFSATGNVSNPVVCKRRGDTTKFLAMGVDDQKFAILLYPNLNTMRRGSTLIADRWYHGVLTYDGTTMNGYLDGVIDTTPTDLTAQTGSNVLDIGRCDLSTDQFFSGSIDDVRIYNRALSVTEVLQLYNLGR